MSGNLGVGGPAGEKRGSIKNSYATGAVSGGSKAGGLVGSHAGLGKSTITGSYWDTTNSGRSSSAGGAGKTYYYLIRAVNETEVGPWSQQVTVTLTDAQSSTSTPTPTPTAPTRSAPVLTARAIEGAVELNWEAVSGALCVWTSSGGWMMAL